MPPASLAVPRRVGWGRALLCGSLVGLALRVVCFFIGVQLLSAAGQVLGAMVPLFPALDPVYTHAAARSLGDLHIQGVAVINPPGDWLNAWLPSVFLPASRTHWAFVRLVVQPGSPVVARLLAAGFAHAAVLSCGLLVVRQGLRHRASSLVVAGIAMQVQVAIGILGAQPSIRELEATGVSFAANALLPWLAPRSAALSDAASPTWPPLVAAILVALALLLGYLPMGLVLLLRDRTRLLTFGTAAVVMIGAAACAGVLRQDVVQAGAIESQPMAAGDVVSAPSASAPLASAALASAPLASAPLAEPSLSLVDYQFDRWFDEPSANPPAGPSHVQIVGAASRYQYLVNGQPQVIKGMGLNTQYAHFMSPSDRAARIDSDMAELSALGVNTVLGWDPAEFDTVLLDAAQRHGIGVILPFDLDPSADYTDPALRQQLHDEVLAWVERYHGHPALRMWGLGNEVLHKIVHPAWVGPQDPERERQAEAFSDWLVWTADDIHALDPDHPVTYRSAEDAFVDWVIAPLKRRGGGPRPWFVWGTNCYQAYLNDIVDHWNELGMPTALWVSEFAPGGMATADRPDGFARMWEYVRRHPDWVLGGAVYAWTRNGPEGVDRDFGLTDDGVPADEASLEMLRTLFNSS